MSVDRTGASRRAAASRRWGTAILLSGATAWALSPVLRNGFISCDDGTYVTANPRVAGGLSSESLAWAFSTGHAANFHPLTWISHMLDVSLFGSSPWGHHLSSLLLHAASTALLFLVLEKMTGALRPSAVAAALFGVHPLHVESVAWVAERKDVLSGLFFMLTLAAYARYVESPSLRRFSPVVLALALGLLAKPMLVSLPFVLLLLDFWPLGRLGKESAGRLVREKLPLFLLVLVSSALTVAAQSRGGAVSSLSEFSLPVRVGNALVAYGAYLGKTIWPFGLSFFYPHLGAPRALPLAVSTLALALLTAVAIRERTRRPYLAVGWLWYVGTLFPVSGVVQVGVQAMADRYTYLPLIGIFVAASWAAAGALRPRGRHARRVAAIAALALLVLLAARARDQVRLWHDSSTLYEHALRVTGNNALVAYFLARTLDQEGHAAEAVSWYERVLGASPDYADARIHLALLLSRMRRTAEAIPHFEEALRGKPDSVQAMTGLGSALMTLGETEKGIVWYESAIALDPAYAEAHSKLGLALARRGDLVRAVLHLEKAVALDPDYTEARQNLAMAYYLGGRYAAAWEEIRAVRRGGVTPEPSLLRLLVEKMPDPGP